MSYRYAKGHYADDAIRVRAALTPDMIVLCEGVISVTAVELNERIDGISARLTEHALSGDEHGAARVGVFLENSVSAVAAILAILRTGLICVPINTKYHDDAIGHIQHQANIQLVLTDVRGAERIKQSDCWLVDDIPAYRYDRFDREIRSPSDPAVIFFTSGSTGKPKGVTVSHANLMYGIDSVMNYLNLGVGQKLGAVLPVSFDAGLNFVLSGLHAGASIALMRYVFPQSFANDLARLEIEGLLAVPSIFSSLSMIQDIPSSKVKFMASTGGRMDASIVSRLLKLFPDLQFTVMYGLTEAFRSTYLTPTDWHKRPTSIGKPIPHAKVDIVLEDGSIAADDEVGEIVHTGPLVAMGYWGEPSLTAQRFCAHPADWPSDECEGKAVYSGDLGRRDGDGFLYFVGRADRMIKSRGYRIAPDEIEKSVVTMSELSAAYVLGVDDPKVGQKIILFVESSDEELSIQKVRQWLRGKVADFMLPDELCVYRQLPLNSNGKIDGTKLKADINHD